MDAHPDWEIDKRPALLSALERAYGETPSGLICPADVSRAFASFCLPPKDVKVGIVGQDPYPRQADANGRAFWSNRAIPRSAKSILDNMRKYGHIKESDLPSVATFPGWERQGVLMTNSALTVQAGEPRSHLEIWQPAVTELLHDKIPPSAVMLLLGEEAAKLRNRLRVPADQIVVHCHPVIPSAEEFQTMDCFGKVNQILVNKLGRTPIDWSQLA